MTSPLNITNLKQGKLHKDHEALWTEVAAQHDAIDTLKRRMRDGLQNAKVFAISFTWLFFH